MQRLVARLLTVVMCLALVAVVVQRVNAARGETCIFDCVSVTPDASPQTKTAGDTYKASFTVTNTGSNSGTYEYSYSCTGGASCSLISTPPTTLGPSESGTMKLWVDVAGSNGVVKVHAIGAARDSGWQNVTVLPSVALTPATSSIYERMPLIQARFYPNDANLDTTTLVVVVGSDTVTPLTRYNRGMMEWQLDSLRQLAAGVARTVSVRICLTNSQCTTATSSLTLDSASGKPLVSFGGMPLEALGRQSGAPLGPGISVSGADVETGFAVPSYTAMDVPRTAGLVYSTRTSHPRALINTDVELTWPAGTPDQIKAVLIDGVARLDSVVVASPSCSASVGRRCRIALQGDFAATTFATPTRKTLTVEVSVTYSGTTKTTSQTVEAVLVDRRAGRYGNGWAPTGVLQIVAAGTDQVIIGPNGSATLYRGNGGQYLSPPGDYSVLKDTASHFELRARDGSKLVFNADGWLSQLVDNSGNITTITYGVAGQVNHVADPTSSYHYIQYNYNGGGKLISLNDHTSRTSAVVINSSNQLVYDSLSSPTSRPYVTRYTYTNSGSSGSSSDTAIVLATRIVEPSSITTTVGYSGRYRPTQATLPAVLPETGSTPQNPVVTYVPQETRALGTIISADSVYAMATDPLGNWTKSALNRWGSPLRVWDVLGTMSRASYSGAGFVTWAEGKVADSTRGYSDYDPFGRLVHTVHWKTGGTRIRLDSLVYDANHNLTQRIDARGQVSRLEYDAYHRVIRAISPNSDTSLTWYKTDGRVDSTRAPGQSGATRFTYGAFGNLTVVTDAANNVLESRWLDSLGHTYDSRRKLTVRTSGGTTYFQWRRTLDSLNDANQPVRVRMERTADCSSPCNSPSWPSSTDSAKFQQVTYHYDVWGRVDSRTDTRGNATTFAFDSLGRVRSRTAPTATVDSFRYDLAGQLRKHYTRRGYLITHLYDSRGRDTLASVPGVGDIRRTFGGPNDELTRQWIASYVDSIGFGAVNPAVSWVFSQAGLLLADTAQGSRVTQYAVDFYGRDSLTTDVVGTWALRYETNRGMLDTILTPLGDTLTYTFNKMGQPDGPALRSGSNALFARSLTYQSTTGKMTALSNVVTGAPYTAGAIGVDADSPDHDLARGWSEKHGGAGASVSQTDTMITDGWQRVTRFDAYRNDTLVRADTFAFDVGGNITRNSEYRVYDAATNQLATLESDGYAYDGAGNLIAWYVASANKQWNYSYDGLDRLVAVRWGTTLVARYAYDVLGRRIVRRVYNAGPNSAATEFVRMMYRGDQVTAEADSGGAVTQSYTWGLASDDLVAIHRHGAGADTAHIYVVQDNLNSVRGLVWRNGSGTWRSSRRYGAYGATLDSAGYDSLSLRYRWIGREFDGETGLYYVRARYFDPNTERFIQEDPKGYEAGPNLYAYGDGNPTNGRDVSGLDKEASRSGFDPKDGWIRSCGSAGVGCYESDPFALLDYAAQLGEFDRWLRESVFASDEQKVSIRETYRNNKGFRETMAVLLGSHLGFYVLDGSYLAGGCLGSGIGFITNNSQGSDFCYHTPIALGERGSRARFQVTSMMERYVGGHITGGLVLTDGIPDSYSSYGDVVWHELTHFLGLFGPSRSVFPYHDHGEFCGVPGPQPNSNMCKPR